MSTKGSIKPKTVGQYLSFCRQQSGLTQDQLASLVKCHRQSIHNYETNKATPPADMWAKMMSALGVAAEESHTVMMELSS